MQINVNAYVCTLLHKGVCAHIYVCMCHVCLYTHMHRIFIYIHEYSTIPMHRKTDTKH